MKLEPVLWLMCLIGFSLHLFKKWGDDRTPDNKVGLRAYLAQNRPQWIASLLASIACMGMLPALPGILGIPPDATPDVLMRVVAFLSGYMGSSLVVSLTDKVTSRVKKEA